MSQDSQTDNIQYAQDTTCAGASSQDDVTVVHEGVLGTPDAEDIPDTPATDQYVPAVAQETPAGVEGSPVAQGATMGAPSDVHEKVAQSAVQDAVGRRHRKDYACNPRSSPEGASTEVPDAEDNLQSPDGVAHSGLDMLDDSSKNARRDQKALTVQINSSCLCKGPVVK
ncbi:hypothetical protein V7S43_011066 [Phytophthora oleae]|uniref:Uncharacterized protein n=1 Tax=Phytophthora oleae TaxID=2107226 RepID=A0ABD3FB45_9STRA